MAESTIKQLRRIWEEQALSLYELYEQSLRKRYISLPQEERINLLRGLELLIDSSDPMLSLKEIKRIVRKQLPKKREEVEAYISTFDEDRQAKIWVMLKSGLDNNQTVEIIRGLRESGIYQEEISRNIGVPSGTLRSSLCQVRRGGRLGISESNARIAKKKA